MTSIKSSGRQHQPALFCKEMEKNAKNGGEFYECVRSSEFIKVI